MQIILFNHMILVLAEILFKIHGDSG